MRILGCFCFEKSMFDEIADGFNPEMAILTIINPEITLQVL